ncbi:hypothetical protein FHR72_004255 [Mycolicibacterium iranicum]|uniref:Serine/threonine protein kinase n=1 Tax=Mycolicibacterium iranicum TaxID=912594 RepID=A0A839QKJ3_MYCIR|nr:hypothetical protein [Mycolicibacterium iranicum]MBB2992751.1 hypothetical protein [Mycolicibacterium iranicum]
MSSTSPLPRRITIAGSAALAAAPLILIAAPGASSAPAYDGRGYLDSTARCAAPDTAVVFGSTASSRIAVCEDADGDLEYRGVRVRDGARLILPATNSADGAFTATNDGIDYMVTADALVISEQEKVLRDEPMVDFHRPGSSGSSTGGSTESPSATEEPAPTTPLPPPLPAEVGGDEGG